MHFPLSLRSKAPLRLSQIPSSFCRPHTLLPILLHPPQPHPPFPTFYPLNHITQHRHRQHRHARVPPHLPDRAPPRIIPSSHFPYFSLDEGILFCVNGMGSLVPSLHAEILRTQQYVPFFEIWLRSKKGAGLGLGKTWPAINISSTLV